MAPTLRLTALTALAATPPCVHSLAEPLAFSFTPQRRRLNPSRCLQRTTSCIKTWPSRVSISTAAPSLQQRQQYSNQERLQFALFAANDDQANDNINEEAKPLDEGTAFKSEQQLESAEPDPDPPQFLALGYKLAAFANLLTGLILVANIGSIASTTISTSSSLASSSSAVAGAGASTRHQLNLLATYTAGSLGHLFLAAGCCNLLSKSIRNNTRLLYTSNTYKRLTMGTFLFGLLGLFSIPGETGCLLSNSSTQTIGAGAFLMMQFAKFVTAFVSFIGWEYSSSAGGSFGITRKERTTNIMKELGRGMKNIYNTLPVTDERPATFYRTFFIFVTLGNLILNVPELVFNLQQGVGLFSLPISLTISSMARLGLLSVILYILKDAAEQKRLEGSTFIGLNIFAGLWAVGVGIAQGLSDGPGNPFNLRRSADKFLFGMLFLNNGVLSQLSKMGMIKDRSEVDPDADPPLRVVF